MRIGATTIAFPPTIAILNYNKYFVEGKSEHSQATDYHSHNTERLDVKGVKEKLLALDYIQDELANLTGELRT